MHKLRISFPRNVVLLSDPFALPSPYSAAPCTIAATAIAQQLPPPTNIARPLIRMTQSRHAPILVPLTLGGLGRSPSGLTRHVGPFLGNPIAGPPNVELPLFREIVPVRAPAVHKLTVRLLQRLELFQCPLGRVGLVDVGMETTGLSPKGFLDFGCGCSPLESQRVVRVGPFHGIGIGEVGSSPECREGIRIRHELVAVLICVIIC